LGRLTRVLPAVSARRQIDEQLEALGAVRVLDPSAREKRIAAQNALQEADRNEKKLLEKQQRLTGLLESLQLNSAVLDRGPSLERLPERLGAYQKAQDDLPALQSRITLAKEDAEAILKQLGRGESLSAVDQLWVEATTRARIEKLAQEGIALESNSAQAVLTKVVGEEQRLQAELRARSEPRETLALKQTLEQARGRLHLEAQKRSLDQQLESAQTRLTNQFFTLPLWRGTPAEARALTLPQPETVERFAAEMEWMARQKERLEGRKTIADERLASTLGELAALRAEGYIASESDLVTARQRRDDLWQELKMLWASGCDPTDAKVTSSVDRYQITVVEADQRADQLWRDAERGATFASLNADRARLEAESAEFVKQLQTIEQHSRDRWQKWREHWTPLGIDPLRPGEMRGWLSRFDKLVESANAVEGLIRDRERMVEEIAVERKCCERELDGIGESYPPELSLSGLVERGQVFLEKLENEARARAQLLRDLSRVSEERRQAETAVQRAREALDAWRARWAAAVAAIGLPANAGVEEAGAVLDGLSRLSQIVQKMRLDQKRGSDIESDARRFAEDIDGLVKACAPELDSLPGVRERAEKLYRIYLEMQIALNRRRELSQELDENRRERDQVTEQREQARAQLVELLRDAQSESVEQLQEAETRSQKVRELSAKQSDLDEQLAREGIALAELIAQTEQVDPDGLAPEIETVRSELETVEAELSADHQKLGTVRQKLAQWDGSAEAADAAAEAEQALADIKALAQSYARVKLASSLLTREIERYRDEKEGPILRRASEIFRQMTLGNFDKLVAKMGAQDQRQLWCLRSSGQDVSVEGLSDGTRDQLYLALRLASLEQHLAANEPLPLILDDIFINFDDQRTRAALDILSSVARQTQVLLFTHHTRMLEIARTTLSPRDFSEHILGPSELPRLLSSDQLG
jgi:hypothetical protein